MSQPSTLPQAGERPKPLACARAVAGAHVRWHSQQGPDELGNALALCALRLALFDLGITEERRIRVSSLYVARNEAGMAVDALAGKPAAAMISGIWSRTSL